MDYLLFDNSKNQMCLKPRGQILLLRILLHGNSYKNCYKKVNLPDSILKASTLPCMASSYPEAIQHLRFRSYHFQMQIWYKQDYLRGENILRCQCNYTGHRSGQQARLCTCMGSLLPARSPLSSSPRGPDKSRDRPKRCEHLPGIANWQQALQCVSQH